jgi:L-aspartate oxidase
MSDHDLTDFSSRIAVRHSAVQHSPVLVVGSGVAGLSVALGIGDCTILTETTLGDGGSSRWAQGGVAVAVATDDTPAAHAADTLKVSAGLGVPAVVRALTNGGPAALVELIRLGARFDRDDQNELALGREAGHSARRIVHANGDATGAELIHTLTSAVRSMQTITVEEDVEVLDLLRDDQRIAGAIVRHVDGTITAHLADAVVLATGGYAHCYERTTTPREVIGTGIAMAARAGAQLADMEFVQFHPTALAVDGVAQMPLLTEALRGEGATLVDDDGRRFMLDEHHDAELAPRDVVARANYRQIRQGNTPALDATTAVGASFPQRFPTVFGLAMQHGLDPRTELLPVSPAAHYCMGGIAVDVDGRTSLAGLWAAGEVTSSGAHGANRLASNSLLEGLVMGRRVAQAIQRSPQPKPASSLEFMLPADLGTMLIAADAPARSATTAGSAAERSAGIEQDIRRLLWTNAGVERTEADLLTARDELDRLACNKLTSSRVRTMHEIAVHIVTAALARCESRGAHHRADIPVTDPEAAERRLINPPATATMHWRLETEGLAAEGVVRSDRVLTGDPRR